MLQLIERLRSELLFQAPSRTQFPIPPDSIPVGRSKSEYCRICGHLGIIGINGR